MTRKAKKLWKLLPALRAIAVLSAVGVITTAVTFAALQSSGNALTGNTIQTANASLLISTQGTAGSFQQSVPGFNFTGLVPGVGAQPAANNYMVYLQNNGTASLKLQLTVPTAPTVTGTVDLSKVSVLITPPDPGLGFPPTTQSIPLANLIAGTVALNSPTTLGIGSTTNYHIQVSMASDAVSGSSAGITNLNLSFSGTPQ